MHALFVTYVLRYCDPAQHAEFCEQLAPAMAAVPGLLAKTWLTNCETGRFGGFYVFASRAAFERYVASELFETLMSPGSVRDVTASEFSVADVPTALTRGPRNSSQEDT
jgi:Putative mono-oxygenase ydhR